MYDLMMWMIVIPIIFMAIKFWVGLIVRLARIGLKTQKTLARGMKQAAAAFAEAGREEE